MKQTLLRKFWLRACMLVAVILCGAGSAWGETKTDILNRDLTGVGNTTQYSNWSNKTSVSTAVYAGNSAGGNESIQLRSNNSNSGVVTTSTGGKVKSLSVTWGSNTTSGRSISVYGKNTAYSSAADLYNSNTQGTLLGTIQYSAGKPTSITVNGDYEYIGFRSYSGALYLSEVRIEWETGGSTTETVATPTFSLVEGYYKGTQSVTISTATAGATIYYTTDGNDPTTSSTQGTSATITESCTLKAIAVKDGYHDSGLGSATYAIVDHAGTEAEPFSVADARNILTVFPSRTFENVYVSGIVSQVDSYNSTYHSITYWISDDGTTNNQFEVYSGKGLDGESFSSKDDLVEGSSVTVKGTIKKYNNTFEFDLNSEIVALEEPVYPIINADETLMLEHDATSGSIEYSITNPADGVNLTATPSANWISNIIVGAEVVTFTTTANEGNEDRTATITLSYTGAETVEVTVTQKHFVADYATLPFEFNGGKANIEDTAGLTQSGLGSDYADPNAPLKFDGTGDYVILKINERPGTLTFDIKNNSFSGGTFKVQTSADGETYTDLKTYTEITDTQNESFSNLGADVRYIKWIYTNKSSGNVGLGNIELAQYSDTPTQTTITAGNLNHVTISTLYDGDMEDITLGDNVAEGTLVYFTLSVDNGFNLESESVKVLDANNDEVELTENQGSWSFTMPNSSVTINATATSSVTPVAGDKYVKVTSTSDLTSGQYLIVYEEESVAFNGGLTSLDAASNTIEVVLNNNEIAVTNATAAAEFTIDVTEGTIKSASGLYIGQTSNANGLAASAETAYTNALSLDEDGNADILSSGGSYLRYNATSGQDRFRYFKSSTYTSQKAIQLYKKVEAEQPITVTVRDAGYTTYVTPAAVSFPVGVEAFIVTAINEGSMHMEAVTAVPANTPIVVKAAAGTYELIEYAEEPNDVSANLLQASNGTVQGGSTIYVLANKSKGVGFYPTATTITIPEGKAYLDTSATGNVKEFIAFDFGGTDAINAIDNGQLTVDSSAIYNVAGQRVGKMTKGIYVVNGKKVIVK